MSPPSHAFAKWLESLDWSDATLFAGRPFHFTYQSLAMKSMFLADLPAELAEVPIDLLSRPLQRLAKLDLYWSSYLNAALMLLLASCQWLVVGKAIESRLSSCKWGKTFLAWLQRYFVLLAALILLFTAVATPLVNAHSRKVAYPRRAIPSK